MAVKKKKIIIPICILLVICLVIGAVFAVMQIQASKKTIDVIPVSHISTYDYGNYSYNEGRVTADVNQTVYLQSDLTVKEVYVQQGDIVAAGTPLMQYDTTLMELDIETKQLDIQKIEMNIKQTTKDLQSLKNGVVPSGVSPFSSNTTGPDATFTVSDRVMSASALGDTSDDTTAPQNTSAALSDTQDPEPQSQTAPETQTPPQTQEPQTTAPETKDSQEPPQTDKPDESQPATDAPQTEKPDESQPATDAPQTDESNESQPATDETNSTESETDENSKFVKILDKDTDLSGFDVNKNGEIEIPCTPDTKLTAEFINIICGKNPDGSDIAPTPENPDPEPVLLKVRLLIDGADNLKLDGSKLGEPYINTKEEFTLQELFDNDKKIPVDEITVLDETFFENYPEAKDSTRKLYIQCTSETLLTPSFIYLMTGRNTDGSENPDGVKRQAWLRLSDLNKILELDGNKLQLPYVTSIDTAIAEFVENGNELSQEPVKELGKDTVLDPSKDHREVYEIYCDDSTVITKDFINRIREEQITVVLKIEGHPSWITLDGSKMEEPSEKAIDTPLAEFIANGIALNEETDDVIGGGDDGFIDGGTGPSYTADEIKKMLNDKQLELSKLQTQKKQALLDLEKLQKNLQDATVTSTITGVVTTMAALDENTSLGEPFIVVSNTEGLYLTGSINELNLNTIQVGQTVSANTYNGVSFEATIREISPYPSTEYYSGGYNPNSSSYPFIAYIENTEGLREGEWASITLGGNSSMNSWENPGNIHIYKAYVGTEDNGQSFVYVANAENRLEKRYVTTGKLLWSSYIEITDGSLTEADYIAFPYDKDIKEGMKTEVASDDIYY